MRSCVCVCACARVRLCEYMCMCSVHVCVRAHTYMRACARARTFAHLVTHSRLLVVDGCSIRFFVIPSARAAPSTHTFTDPHSHVAAVVELRRGGGAQAFDTLTQQQMPPLAMPSLHPVVGRDARREGRGGGAGCRRLDAHALRRGASCSIARGDTRMTPKVVIPVQVWGKGSVSELLVHLQLYVRALIWGAWHAALCLRLCLRWSFALMVDQGKLNFCTGRLLPKIMMNIQKGPAAAAYRHAPQRLHAYQRAAGEYTPHVPATLPSVPPRGMHPRPSAHPWPRVLPYLPFCIGTHSRCAQG